MSIWFTLCDRPLVDNGMVAEKELSMPREATREKLQRVHTRDYLDRLEGRGDYGQ